MSVGGLHHLIVGPVVLPHVGEGGQAPLVAVHIVLIRRAVQQTVHDGDHLGAVDLLGGPEGAVIYTKKLQAELRDTMEMCGAHSLAEIDRSMIFGY